jgi:hypothetical protein
MKRKRQNQAYENKKQMFVDALNANDRIVYDWIIGFNATQHMTFERKWFTIYEPIVPQRAYMGDDTILEAIDKGNIKATMQVVGKVLFTTITQVLYVPKMKNNVIYVGKLIFKKLESGVW